MLGITMPYEIKLFRGARKIYALIVLCLLFASPVLAAQGDAENGENIYMKKCWWCHGKEGEGDGPASKFMMPPPRDFSGGVYKYKTSPPTSDVARAEDLFNMISNGMPGTVMPSWKDILSDQDRWDLVAYIRNKLTDMFEGTDNPKEIDYGKKIASSPESIEQGKKAFEDAKCWECHGRAGKGDTMKKLKEESGARVWPRNLTKPWTFRGGYTPEAIFARVSNGIPNTPMPSFAAKETGSGKLSEEDRWHVANYVMSLADENRQIKEGVIVIKGFPADQLPKDVNDELWNGINGTAFLLVPQIIQKDRFFTPSNDLVHVKVLFTEKDIAFLIEFDDRSKSVPGDKVAEAIAWEGLSPDGIAIQTPVIAPESSEKPYFGHGDASHPVSMLYWNSGSTEEPNVTKMITATGSRSRKESDPEAAGFKVSAAYHEGTWKVMMVRSLLTPNKDNDTQFETGRYIPIAFANWDGSNGERGSKHTMTTWRWLLLQPETSSNVVTYPGGVFLVLVFGQLLFSRFLRKTT